MRKELQLIEEIENYLLNNMNAEEKGAFEMKMKSDEPLSQQVEAQRRIIDRIKLRAFRQEMMALHPVMPTGSRFDWLKNKIYLNSIVAVFALSLAATAIYYTVIRTEKQKQAQAETKPEEQDLTASTPVGKAESNLSGEGKILPLGKSKALHNKLELRFESQTIDAGKDEVFQMKDSKSVLHFPANILEHQDGRPVKGKVKIRYREYRNSAQTAFSGIPMTYSEKGKNYNFNSAGMFEIRATQNNEVLRVKNGCSFQVDYNATEQLDNCYFFELNEGNGRWRKQQPINFTRKPSAQQTQAIQIVEAENKNSSKPQKKYLSGILQGTAKDAASNEYISGLKIELFNKSNVLSKNLLRDYDSGYVVTGIKVGQYSAKITCKGYASMYLERIIIGKDKITQLDISLKPMKQMKKKSAFQQAIALFDWSKEKQKEKTLVKGSFELQDTICNVPEDFDEQLHKKMGLNKKQAQNPAAKVMPEAVQTREVDSVAASKIKSGGNRNGNTLLAENINAGHTYPNLVKGLNCPSFGVYNCDQIYQVPNPITINASYTDEKGQAITDGNVLSMIDLQYNGAFSFDPRNFICGKTGRNVLLLFTKSQKLYVLPEAEFKKMKIRGSGNYTFAMKDISETVKTTENLKKYLGLK